MRALHEYCLGFRQPVDLSHQAWRRFHSLMNQRNSLLHGRIEISELKFNEVYFAGRVPVFKKYRSMWERAYEIQRQAVGLDKVKDEIRVVDEFIDYVLSCLDDKNRVGVEQLTQSIELGLHKKEHRVGLLFSETLSDFRMQGTQE